MQYCLHSLPSALALSERVHVFVQEQQRALREAMAAPGYRTPKASPASQRSSRSQSAAGRPSPESAASMGAPPPFKRPQPASRQPPKRDDPPTRGAQQQKATGAAPPSRPTEMPPPPPRPNAWHARSGSIGEKQHATVMELDAAAFPPLAATQHHGRHQQSAAAISHQRPNIMAAAEASAAVLYASPRTDPKPRAQPPVTRGAQAEGRADIGPTMEQRLAALQPKGRVQRAEASSCTMTVPSWTSLWIRPRPLRRLRILTRTEVSVVPLFCPCAGHVHVYSYVVSLSLVHCSYGITAHCGTNDQARSRIRSWYETVSVGMAMAHAEYCMALFTGCSLYMYAQRKKTPPGGA